MAIMKSKTTTVGVRVQKTLNKMILLCVKSKIITSKSEFIRIAIQEKIQRDFPQVWQLFSSKLTEEEKSVLKSQIENQPSENIEPSTSTEVN